MNYKLFIQALFVLIVLGAVYNLWKTTRTFGGIIGSGLKWIGLGILFFAIEALDRVLGDIGFLSSLNLGDSETIHNLLLLLGLFFSAVGFSRLTRVTKG